MKIKKKKKEKIIKKNSKFLFFWIKKNKTCTFL